MTESKSAIQIESLSYAYPDGTLALDKITLEIKVGERVAFIGANGAGKSTLLMHLNGIIENRGVNVLGLSVVKSNLSIIRQKVGLVFQNPDDQLFCPTIAEDVAFGPKNMKLPADEVKLRVHDSLHAVGLDSLGEKSAYHLSIGQKKRAAIATVLAMRPEILALDEPTSNLDPKGRRELIELLNAIGGTMVIATHDFDLARHLCSRVVMMDKGKIVADGSPNELLANHELLKIHELE